MRENRKHLFSTLDLILSLPRPSHPPQWASDGEEPSPIFSIRSDVSLITEKEMLL
jgi:hypothetical protein